MTSYGTESGAIDYHAARGNAQWASATTQQQDQARLRASEYIDYQFRAQFPGYKALLREQVREWPRAWAYDDENNSIPDDEVPVEVEYATYEASLRELASPGSLLPDYISNQQVKREKVDVLEVEYSGGVGPESAKPILTIVRGILEPILTGPASSSLSGRSARI